MKNTHLRCILFVIATCAAATLPAAADEWSKTYNLTANPKLHIETSDANIRVETWEQNTIETRVTAEGWKIGAGGLTIVEHQTGDMVDLEVRFPHEFNKGFHLPRHRVKIDIHMPREGQVNLHTGDGDILLNQFKGEMDLSSGDGKLTNMTSGVITGGTGSLARMRGIISSHGPSEPKAGINANQTEIDYWME